jgi:pimeloyl-ACP methyl ester carboxylesterase
VTSPTVLGRFIEVRGGPLYADIREGNGPALVFLHYWGGSRRTWTKVLTRLDPGQAFVAYDQRGWGNSYDVPGLYTWNSSPTTRLDCGTPRPAR